MGPSISLGPLLDHDMSQDTPRDSNRTSTEPPKPMDQETSPFSTGFEKNYLTNLKISNLPDQSDDSHNFTNYLIDKRFKILKKIGAGGQCTVFKALDMEINQKVALKTLNSLPGGSNQQEIYQRFRNESLTIGNLTHPDIIQIKTTCNDEKLGPVLVLEYVEGKNLGELIKERMLPPKLAAKLFIRIGKALAHAHNRSQTNREDGSVNDIIHRDMKPSNILIGNEDKFYLDPSDTDVQVKIADFGLGKFIGDNTANPFTGTHSIMGTPSYMSPEQAKGEPVGKSSDIYSLGATLYEALTGRPPFTGQSLMHVFKQVIEKEPTPPSVIDNQIPAMLDAICMKCLEKKPGDRYLRVEDFVDDLQKWVNDNPNTIVRVPTLFSKILKKIKNNPVPTGLAVGVLCVFALGSYLVLEKLEKDRINEKRAQEEDANKTLKKLVDVSETSIKRIKANIERLGFNDDIAHLYKDLEYFYRELSQVQNDDTIIERGKIASANLGLAEVIEKVGTRDEALEAYDNTITIYQNIEKQQKKLDGGLILKLADAMGKKGWNLIQMRRFSEARSLLNSGLDKINQLEKSISNKIDGATTPLSEIHKTKGLLYHYLANLEAEDDLTVPDPLGGKTADAQESNKKQFDLALENYGLSIAQFRQALLLNPDDKQAQWYLARAYGFRGDVQATSQIGNYVAAESDYHESHRQRVAYLKKLLDENNKAIKNDFVIDYSLIKYERVENKHEVKEAVLQLNRSFGNFSELNYGLRFINSAIYFAELQGNLIEPLYFDNQADYDCLGDYSYSINRLAFLRLCRAYVEYPEIATIPSTLKASIEETVEKIKKLNQTKLDDLIQRKAGQVSPSLLFSWIQSKMLIAECHRISHPSDHSGFYKILKEISDTVESKPAEFQAGFSETANFYMARIHGFLGMGDGTPQSRNPVEWEKARKYFHKATAKQLEFDYEEYFLKGPDRDPALAFLRDGSNPS